MTSPNRPPTDSSAHVVLLGLMGTGKTVVARALAPQLGMPFTDNDAAIGAATDLTAREIRSRHGTRVLHNLEARHLLDALAKPEPTVICAAGSVVEDERCRRALSRPELLRIWLRARPETLAARFHTQDHRPLFGDDPLALFVHQIANRSGYFAELADGIVDVDGVSIDEVVARVAAIVERRNGLSPRSRIVELDVDAALAPEPDA